MIDEYLRRNLIIAKSVGVCSGIKAVINVLNTRKRKPKKILKILQTISIQSENVNNELIKHRDEIII
jgi:predicted small secreted protein